MNLLKQLLHPWIVVGTLLIGALLVALTFAALYLTQPEFDQPGVPTAVIAVIPAPTLTPQISPTPIPSPSPTLEVPPSPLPGVFAAGAIVQIQDTGGRGLNLRETPGLESPIQYLGLESEVFTIQEGPQEADGFVWWYIVGFSDPGRAGWAAANFLQLVQTP